MSFVGLVFVLSFCVVIFNVVILRVNMNIDFFVLSGSGDDFSKVEYQYSIDIGECDFVPRVGDFTSIPGSSKVFVVRRVLVSWIVDSKKLLRFVPRVRVDLGFVDKSVFSEY